MIHIMLLLQNSKSNYGILYLSPKRDRFRRVSVFHLQGARGSIPSFLVSAGAQDACILRIDSPRRDSHRNEGEIWLVCSGV